MPQVIQKAREVMADPNSSFKDLAIIFVTDQAIATRVLKLSNSAYYGLSKKVSSIQQASVVLGHKTLAEIITMLSTSDMLGGSLKGYGLDAGALWQHSLAVAFGSRIIAKKSYPEATDDAFAAGLIHDSGKLVLDAFVLEKKEEFENYMASDHDSFLVAEKAILGLDHAEIASEVCQKWNVPEDVAVAIRYHHHPEENNDSTLAKILHVADGIAMMSGLGTGVDALSYEIEETAIKALGLESTDVNTIMDKMVASVQNTIKEYQ
jgi:HD-like signal output (HDOD) protein